MARFHVLALALATPSNALFMYNNPLSQVNSRATALDQPSRCTCTRARFEKATRTRADIDTHSPTHASCRSQLFDSYAYEPRYEPRYTSSVRVLSKPASPTWTSSAAAMELTIAVPALEEDSLSASLSADGKSLTISGRRAYEGCACQESVLFEVPLPFTPRSAEAFELTHDEKAGLLSLRMAKFPEDEREAQPLKISKPPPKPPPTTTSETTTTTSRAADAVGARAVGSTLTLAQRQEKEEKALEDKFKGLARIARLAVATVTESKTDEPKPEEPTSAQDAPAAGDEPAAQPAAEAGHPEAPAAEAAEKEKTAAEVAGEAPGAADNASSVA